MLDGACVISIGFKIPRNKGPCDELGPFSYTDLPMPMQYSM